MSLRDKEITFYTSKQNSKIGGFKGYFTEDIAEFIQKIKDKVFLAWRGQNEFVDWLNKEVGNEKSKRGFGRSYGY